MSMTESVNEIAKTLIRTAADLCYLAEIIQDACKMDSGTLPAEKKEEAKQPEQAETIPLEKIRGVLADKSRNGHTAEVREIIKSFGADRLSSIDPKNYAEVLKKAEAL